MIRPPKIIVTDIDEDPVLKRKLRNNEIKDWSALAIIVALLWLLAATRMCMILASVTATVTTMLATVQFVVMVKSPYSRFIGNNMYKAGPEYQMPAHIYFRNVKQFITCANNNKIATSAPKPDDPMSDNHIPKMHSPL